MVDKQITVSEWALARRMARILRIRNAGAAYKSTLEDTLLIEEILELVRGGKIAEAILKDAVIAAKVKIILQKGGTTALAGLLRSSMNKPAIASAS